ncbi:MAG: hypothetical protein ACFCGT_05340 [Sandaracinaceae bacterium]
MLLSGLLLGALAAPALLAVTWWRARAHVRAGALAPWIGLPLVLGLTAAAFALALHLDGTRGAWTFALTLVVARRLALAVLARRGVGAP